MVGGQKTLLLTLIGAQPQHVLELLTPSHPSLSPSTTFKCLVSILLSKMNPQQSPLYPRLTTSLSFSHPPLQPVEGPNEFLQLLKSHKEKLEEGMRDLRRTNEQLEREKEEGEKEKERMRRCIDQLQAKLAQAQVTLGRRE